MGLKAQTQVAMPVIYGEEKINVGYRIDLLVDNCIIVELKAVDYILPVHEAQIITYMKLLKVPQGLMINFNTVNIFHEGQKTYVNELFRSLPD